MGYTTSLAATNTMNDIGLAPSTVRVAIVDQAAHAFDLVVNAAGWEELPHVPSKSSPVRC